MQTREAYCGDWPIDRPFRVKVTANASDVAAPYTPFAVELDFAALLQSADSEGEFDRNSVLVTRIDGTDRQMPIAHSMSEWFAVRQCGDISWVIEQADQLEYYVYFDIAANGPYTPPAQIAAVGNGDALRGNTMQGEPVDVGIPCQAPVYLDLTGDGRLDMLIGSIYSNTVGFPYHCTFVFRNIGTNAKPLYEDFTRLHVDGDIPPVGVFAAVDWNGNGLIDLVAKPYMSNEVQVLLNTGQRDANGLPVYTKGEAIDLSDVTGPGGQCGLGSMQLVDLHGDGRLFLVGVGRELSDKSKYGHIFGPYYDNYVVVFENDSPAGAAPKFTKSYRLTDSEGEVLSVKGSCSGIICDWNQDGVWDVVLQETQDNSARQVMRLFRNEGSNTRPKLVDAGLLAGGEYLWPGLQYYDNECYKGFMALEKTDFFRYVEVTGVEDGMPVLCDRGYMHQLNGRVTVGQYSWPFVCDWDGDGGRDIVAGSCSGSPFVIEEVGRQDPPVYKPRRILESAGEPIWHTWCSAFGQMGGERTEGYWEPAVVDWDGDGLPDLLAPVGISHGKFVDGEVLPDGRLFFYKNIGTRNQPRYGEAQEVTLADGSPAMAAAVAFPVDWDGDGTAELVAFDMSDRLCVFKLADPADPLTLLPGKPLMMADGTEFSAQKVYDLVGRMWSLNQTVCDWDNRGVWDVIIGTREAMFLFRNEGTNEQPAFADGEELELWGEPIKHSVHSLRPCAVDWDDTGRCDLLVGGESGWMYLFRRPVFDGARPESVIGDVQTKK